MKKYVVSHIDYAPRKYDNSLQARAIRREYVVQCLAAIEDNNKINQGKYADWSDSHHIADTFKLLLSDYDHELLDKILAHNIEIEQKENRKVVYMKDLTILKNKFTDAHCATLPLAVERAEGLLGCELSDSVKRNLIYQHCDGLFYIREFDFK